MSLCDTCGTREATITRDDLHFVDKTTVSRTRPFMLCVVCAGRSEEAVRFGKALAPSDVAADAELLWPRAWLGMAHGVTPCIFVPTSDGCVERVRVREDHGYIEQEDLREMSARVAQGDTFSADDVRVLLAEIHETRNVLSWVSTHDVTTGKGARKAQRMCAKALRRKYSASADPEDHRTNEARPRRPARKKRAAHQVGVRPVT